MVVSQRGAGRVRLASTRSQVHPLPDKLYQQCANPPIPHLGAGPYSNQIAHLGKRGHWPASLDGMAAPACAEGRRICGVCPPAAWPACSRCPCLPTAGPHPLQRMRFGGSRRRWGGAKWGGSFVPAPARCRPFGHPGHRALRSCLSATPCKCIHLRSCLCLSSSHITLAVRLQVHDVAQIHEQATGLAPPSRWDLVADRQTMQEEQPLQARTALRGGCTSGGAALVAPLLLHAGLAILRSSAGQAPSRTPLPCHAFCASPTLLAAALVPLPRRW